jgi:hypothetical protein
MSEEPTVKRLFDVTPEWEDHWVGMPEFVQEDAEPFDSIIVHFRNRENRIEFLEKNGYDPLRRKSIWYPHEPYLQMSEPAKEGVQVAPGRYPVYVISKGRAETRLTSKALDLLGLPYRLVVEPHEREEYLHELGGREEYLLTLPFSNLGQGSIPARNWVWDHAVAEGHSRHWILDDNLDGFYRLNRNLKYRVREENPFTAAEDFVDRYENVALAGLQYESFAPRRTKMAPYRLNTRIYSCILINHQLNHRWRGRYNEDTDLSLRALKDGWVTVLFNAFLCKKAPTMTMTGGNTDELYANDGRLQMAESLVSQHPDCVTVTSKWGRPQHQVNYTAFRDNGLIRRNEMTGDSADHKED